MENISIKLEITESTELFTLLKQTDTLLREKIKAFLLEKLVDTNEDNPLEISVLLNGGDEQNNDFAPHLTAMYINEIGYITFVVDEDTEFEFEGIHTLELAYIYDIFKK